MVFNQGRKHWFEKGKERIGNKGKGKRYEEIGA
jgi:hypothetical protein